MIAIGASGRSIAHASQAVDGVGWIPTHFRVSLLRPTAGLEFRPLALNVQPQPCPCVSAEGVARVRWAGVSALPSRLHLWRLTHEQRR